MVSYTYDAWGKLISKIGTLAGTLGTIQPFRYRGYVYDEETACYYLKTRYYNSVICRFVNADSIIFSNASHNMNNLYSYCKGSPVNYADENGLMGITIAGCSIMEMLKVACIYLLKGLGLFGATVVGTELGTAIGSYNSADYNTSIAVPMPAPPPAPQTTSAPLISISQVTVTGTTTVAQLDQTVVGEKSKKTKPQYWSAYVDKNSSFVIAGCSLSYSAAQARVMEGGDVLAINQSAAYALVKFSGNYVGPEIHHGSKGYYLPHYHVRHGGSHVFFLDGITY